MEDPAGLLQFECAVVLTEELHHRLTRHPHTLHLVLCLLQTLLGHLQARFGSMHWFHPWSKETGADA